MESQDYRALQVILYVYVESLCSCFGEKLLKELRSSLEVQKIKLIWLFDQIFFNLILVLQYKLNLHWHLQDNTLFSSVTWMFVY